MVRLSSTRIDIDQSTKEQGFATITIFGTNEGILEARRLIANELSKVGPEAAAHIANETQNRLVGQAGGTQDLPPQSVGSDECDTITIPLAYIGWLKGKNGGALRELEGGSGAVLDIDQSTKEMGYAVVKIRGPADKRKIGYGLVISQVTKVAHQSGPVDWSKVSDIGCWAEFHIEQEYVG